MPEPEDDWLNEVRLIAAGAIERFPRHNDIFHLVSRLAEETGEVAQQINHLEGMGVKRERHGEPDVGDLAEEILDVVRCAVTIALHYHCVDDLRRLTAEKLASYRREGWVS
ncbi:MazG nucleotide pyrophosphohydrolase domain-containing protein [Streptomyces sp. NBC_00199]|uniref:MazG nucleotide pyrophosphohydrolase domain-containing protein n=1 Tax=Streptomyces sp. NBC_00199 TaxID=2975678 RepID=UPI00224D23B8|nr:MazG nucleotide pyrophosphohydrolase domain-containing protein [Streptomyces sp. NBC_00199]MCX5269501.1 hypothetical protein [Streptomyces sp. NBC_00199]